MARSGPISLTLPPFTGATRKVVLWNLASFFILLVLDLFRGGPVAYLVSHLQLIPALVLHGEVWQCVTYAFFNTGLLATLFNLLFLWFIGSMLEAERGGRWLYELYFTAAIGGAVLATLLALIPHVGDGLGVTGGPYAALLGLMVAVGVLFGEQEFVFWFVLRLKAKYLLAIMLLIAGALLFWPAQRLGAMVQLCAAGSAWLFLRFVPRRGLVYGVGERMYGLRNEMHRAKRRRAARQFEVYMRKQDREVRFDRDGRYIDPDRNGRDQDLNDKRWMN